MHDFSSHQRPAENTLYLWQHFKLFMPVLRNVNSSRQSGRLGKQTPVIYGGDGWPTPESINHIPNGQPLNGSMLQCPSSFSSLVISRPDRQHSHSRQQERKPCIPSDGLPYHPSTINASCLPSLRHRYTRHREPGHIPRPRNAFIFFRSSYITGRTAAGEGQQNELSKQAGKVWNRMTEDEKAPFADLADDEKKKHQKMYPNYVYCPGSARRKSSASIKKARSPKEITPSSTLLVSSKSTTPEIPSAAPTLRPPRAAAQLAVQRFLQDHSISPSPTPASPPPEDSPMQESLDVAYPERNPPVRMAVVVPTAGTPASEPDTPIEKDDFVPTADIPELELTPSGKKEPEHAFDLSMRPSHLDRIPEQFGFEYHNNSTATVMLAHLPPMPNLDDTTSTSDTPPSCSRTPSPVNLPTTPVLDDMGMSECLMTGNILGFWQPPAAHWTEPTPDFSSCSRTPSPTNFPTSPMSCYTSVVFSNDGNVPDCYYQQQPMDSLTAPRQPIPGFTWSSDHENDFYDTMSSEDTMVEDDLSFMSSFFNFDPHE